MPLSVSDLMSKTSTTNRQTVRRKPADQYIIWAVLILCAFGVVAVYSSISFLAQSKAGGDTELFLLRHVVRVGLALGAMMVFSIVDYRMLAKVSKPALLLAIGLLIAVPLIGVASGGAARWIRLGSFVFQPSDVAKVALMLYIAVLLTRKQKYIKDFSRAFVPLFIWILGTAILIGVQDLSTAALLTVSATAMCFVGRASVVHLGGLVTAGVVLAFILLLFSPGRAARVESYLGVKLFPNTEEEHVFSSQDEGYQAQQARIAIAMGGVTGVGPGKSVQRDFLPAPYNDFIIAIIAEEYGALGVVLVLGLYVVILFRGFLRVARNAPDPLGLFLGVGLTTMLALYAFVHAGVGFGLFPVTGLPMPLISYGGTSMIATGTMIGILLNISRQTD